MDLTRLTLRGSLPRLALGAVLALAALAALGAATASAQVVADPDYWKQTTQHRDTVYRLVYSQSPQSIPASYDSVREAEEILRQQQRTLPPSNPQARSLWLQTRGLTVKSALSRAPRVLGTIGLAVGTFEIGWKIGSDLNAKFLRIGVPEEIPHTNTDFRGTGYAQELVWNAAGYSPYYDRVIQPVDGFTWMRTTDSGRYGYWRTGAPEVTCDMNRVVPPIELTVVTTAFPGKSCGQGAERASTDYNLAYLTEEELGAPGPIEPYTGQPYTKSKSAPTPPAQSTVEQTIDEELGKPENADLRQWLNHKLGSPGETDPTGIGAPNPDIEFPGFVEHWERHGDEFTTPYADPVEYWRDAAEIVERGSNNDPDILKCERFGEDPADVYFDPARQAIVIVKDGKIVTYFVPDQPGMTPFEYWLNECG